MNYNEQEEVLFESEVADAYQLIVWNDDVNTFDWVIKALMDICSMHYEQAEQCSLIIHFKGKCAVQSGAYNELKKMCEEITERGIGATVEERVS